MPRFLFAALLLPAPAWAACPASVADLRTATAEALRAWVDLDLEAFPTHYAAVVEAEGCVTAPLSSVEAADLHLVHALDAWGRRDEAATRAALVGLHETDRAYPLSEGIAPQGSGLRALWDAVQTATVTTTPLPAHAAGTWRVDGRARSDVAADGASTYVQRLDGDALAGSWYLASGAADPRYAELVAAVPKSAGTEARATVPRDPAPERKIPAGPPPERPISRPLAIGAGAATVGSVALLGVAASARSRFLDEASPTNPMESTYQLNQAAGYGGYALGVAAIGLGAGAVVAGRW
jgi:hypothetical protein